MTPKRTDKNTGQNGPGGNIIRYAIALLVLLVALWFIFLQPAFADDNNAVNPQQLPDSSFIYDTSIADLGTADSYYNNQTVQVVGEVTGDRVVSDLWSDSCWITLSSTEEPLNASVSIFMSLADSEKIDTYGKYGKEGTRLQVRGTFHLSCSQHDGITDLHAEHVTIAEKGKDVSDTFDIMKFLPGVFVVIIGLGLMFFYRHMRERMR